MSDVARDTGDAEFILAEIARRRRRSLPGRVTLGVMAACQLVLALPWLAGVSPLWSASFASSHHLTRDGAIGLILGATGMAVALNPRLAWFALPLVLLLVGVQGVFFFVDHSQFSVTHLFESIHLLGVAIVLGIGIFALPNPIRRSGRPRHRHLRGGPPRLRVVRPLD